MAKTDETPDPLKLWREWVDQSERQWNSVLTEFMSTEQFGQASGKAMEAFLALQASANEATQRYFSALNLPTRTDILSLGERLAAIERSLEDLSDRLEALHPPAVSEAPARPRPKRTKKRPPSKRS